MQKQVKKTKKRLLSILFALICLAILTNIVINNAEQYSPKEKADSNSSFDINTKNTEEEWCLTLVNKWNPIQTDIQIELTELSNGQCVDNRIYPYLQKMFDDARKDGIYPIVASGYRTQEKQQQIYDQKIASYIAQGYSDSEAKKEAESWVAIPGTSEHQLGLGIDINADGIHSSGNEVYKWLEHNAHLYGFIYRYPPNKTELTGISNEPWHYRYVGVDAATEIYNRGICLEEYLSKTN